MGRLMGLDYGSKTTGVALSDPLKTIASPFETIERDKENKLRHTLRRIADIVCEYDVELIALGEPLHLNGEEGERVRKTREFKDTLASRLNAEGINIPIVFVDERLTTAAADEILEESGVAGHERKRYIDKIAAALILEEYMNSGTQTASEGM